jgi:hypothetical protein
MSYVPDPHEEQYRSVYQPTIQVIERADESYDEYHERKKKEESGARKVPFGFLRALSDEEPDS